MPPKSAPPAIRQFPELINTSEPPDLGPGPRASVIALPALNQKLNDWLARASFPAGVHEPIRGAILLWHDHLDAAHKIAQDLPGANGSLLHAIMHRREPDYGNAKYWFQRAGQHPCFAELACRVAALPELKSHPALRDDLLPRGAWDAFAFVDACESAAGRPATDPQTHFLRAVQAMETQVFLEHLCRPPSPLTYAR